MGGSAKRPNGSVPSSLSAFDHPPLAFEVIPPERTKHGTVEVQCDGVAFGVSFFQCMHTFGNFTHQFFGGIFTFNLFNLSLRNCMKKLKSFMLQSLGIN